MAGEIQMPIWPEKNRHSKDFENEKGETKYSNPWILISDDNVRHNLWTFLTNHYCV